jgi:hypothetical protein
MRAGHWVSTAGHRVGMVLVAVRMGPIWAVLLPAWATRFAGADATSGAGAGDDSAISSVIE